MLTFQAVWKCDCKCACVSVTTGTMWGYVNSYNEVELEADTIKGWYNCGSINSPERVLCPNCYTRHGLK